MHRNLIFATLLCLLMPALASAAESDQKDAELKVLQYVEWQSKLFEAVLRAKDAATLEALGVVAGESAAGMSSSASALKKMKLEESQRRRMASIAATREYELYGNRDMTIALQSAPAEFQPRIIEMFQPHMERFVAADEAFTAALVQGFPGTGWQQITVTFDDVFRVSIVSIHRDIDTKLPPHSMAFSIRAEHPNDPDQLESMDVFEHVIPWSEGIPSKEELKKWISFDAKKRMVNFTYPGGSASYQLPTKREDAAVQPTPPGDAK